MMLHEAVMLEIYRQALSASELVSPRCQSRESNSSVVAPTETRCPSSDSVYSAHDAANGTTPLATATANTVLTTPISPQLELPLAPTISPTQSAAMAAYLNAANHLFLSNPLAATLVHAAPTAATRQLLAEEETALDFSVKPEPGKQSDEEEEDEEEQQLTNSEENSESTTTDLSAPLDLSCSSRKRQSLQKDVTPSSPNHKIARINDFKSWATPNINPYLAAVAAASLSPKLNNDWKKSPSNEAAKALERMTEMTRLGAEKSEMPPKPTVSSAASPTPTTQTNGNNNGRHSAWQSHWLNKGAHSVKDVFKCVWCKQSFPTLATLTTHMKETKHCGVNMPTSASNNATSPVSHASSVSSSHANTTTTTSTTSGCNNGSKKTDLNLLIKETMPLPRKLVRGQDVWLGKGAEQTRQILKCMWCGQSFRSLAEMTSHMQETQHYTNIISQEQIISWKSSDDKTVNGSTSPNTAPSNGANNLTVTNMSNNNTTTNTVSAVLTCKVCDQAFSSLKELSNHMVKNSHYKEPIIRQSSESPGLGLPRRGRQMREKRKKSLPVRKLLELERASGDYSKSTNNVLDPALKPLRDFAASTKITCEKCSEKIETAFFVDHIRQCLGGMLLNTPRNGPTKSNVYENRRNNDESRQITPLNATQSTDILTPPKENEKNNSLPSVLNAIEQLIEKSFDIRPPRAYGGSNSNNTPLGSSILKRLGIDDNVDYTKPLIDVQPMRFRSGSSYSSARDRSASESSSISERCGSSLLEAATPERPQDMSGGATPRLQTPEKSSVPKLLSPYNENNEKQIKIKIEQNLEEDREIVPQKITVKKEFNETNSADGETNQVETSIDMSTIKPANTPESEGSQTSNNLVNEKKSTGSSLNALSSMFDSLNNTLTFTGETNNNNNNINNNNNNYNNMNNSGNNGKIKKSNGNPLAALQKLCENTNDPQRNNNNNNNNNSGGNNNNNNNNNNVGVASGMLGFGWDTDTMIKCAYCDTSFYTKGAYRHHLQKVHFIKGEELDSPKSNINSPRSTSKSPAGSRTELSPALNVNPYEESPQSKFRKYTELAKQLSSKNN